MSFPVCLWVVFFNFLATLSHSKVYEIFERDHFHDLIQDIPVGSRFSAVIAFYNDTQECNVALHNSLDYTSNNLPAVDHLLVGQFDFRTARSRIWYEYEDHLDLPEKIGINRYISEQDSCECPIIVYIPSSYCDGMGDDYLSDPPLDGIEIWDSYAQESYPDWRQWIWMQMKMTVRVIQPLPFDYQITVQHQTINSFHGAIEAKPWSVEYNVDSVQSHQEIEVYPGDSVLISVDPKVNVQMRHKKQEELRANGIQPAGKRSSNPSYEMHAGLQELQVIQLENGQWGFEYTRHASITAAFIARRHATTMMTHTRNLIIPQILPSNHPLGFEKLSMPDGLHERLKRFYRRWYHNKAVEGWDSVGTQLNFFDVKSHMISLDHDFHERDAIAKGIIGPMLMDWANNHGADIKEVSFTAFYGIREYSRNAVLRNHVDRVDTHVLSAILQIGQTNIDEPWPLEVIGFDGKRYRITLMPGEMILYEGHRLIHGRPEPFYGQQFANCFVHFKPSGYTWNTGRVWKTEIAKRTLNEMHINLRDIYR